MLIYCFSIIIQTKIQMIRAQNNYQMARYFSSFLTDVAIILKNIKQRVYELVEVSMNNRNINIVLPTMPSIILATTKTYNDLKRIQLILNGVVRSKRLYPSSDRIYSNRGKSHQASLLHSPLQQLKQDLNAGHSFKLFDLNTTKHQWVYQHKAQIKQQIQKSASSQQETDLIMLKKQNIEESKTIKCEKKQNNKEKGINKVIFNVEQRINSIIMNNRHALTSIIDRNNECLRMVRSVKKDIRLKD